MNNIDTQSLSNDLRVALSTSFAPQNLIDNNNLKLFAKHITHKAKELSLDASSVLDELSNSFTPLHNNNINNNKEKNLHLFERVHTTDKGANNRQNMKLVLNVNMNEFYL